MVTVKPMKRIMILMAAALVSAACSKSSPELVEWTFTASNPTRAAISDSGAFSWNAGDEIGIWNNTSGAFVTFTDAVGKGVYRASAPADAHFTTAIYPASAAVGQSSVTLPASYASTEASASVFPMCASVDEKTNSLPFKHLGAILRITVTDITSDMTYLGISSSDGSISGTFDISGGKISLQEGSGNAGVVFPLSLGEKGDVTVSLPMPTGTYEYSVKVGTSSDNVVFTAATGASKQTFERGKIYKPSAVTFINGTVILEVGAEVESMGVDDEGSIWL